MTPHPIVPHFQYQKFDAITFPNGKRVYLTPPGQYVPSVTTIISATLPKDGLVKWRERIGDEEADRQVAEACRIGSTMHDRLEGYVSNYLQGRPNLLPDTDEDKLAYTMADNMIRYALLDLDEVWGIEEAVYADGLFAGRTDLVGVYKGKSAVIDYKSSKMWKRDEWIEGYKYQIAAYNFCHKCMFGQGMETGVILISIRPPNKKIIQAVILTQSDLDRYEDKWLRLVEKFYEDGGWQAQGSK